MKKSLIPDTWLMLLQLEELGSFSKVGERRGIAPSSVKRRLDDLQSRFDQPIYRAEPTGVFLPRLERGLPPVSGHLSRHSLNLMRSLNP